MVAEVVRYAIPAVVADLDIDAHHVIEASAGTGKTFVIEHRIVDLIVRGKAQLSDILVVTFTDKATAELKRRVRALITKVARARESTAAPDEPFWPIDAAARGRLEAALQNFDSAAISTIHGFCYRVLTDSAFSAGRLFEQVQIHEESAFDEAFHAELRERFARDDEYRPWLDAFLARGYFEPVAELQKVLFQCARARADIAPPFSEADIMEAAEDFTGKVTGADIDALLGKMAQRSKNVLVRKVEKLARAQAHPALVIGAVEAACEGDRGTTRKQFERAKKTAAAPIAEAALVLIDTCPPLKAAIAQRFLPHVIDRAQADKAARGKLDYADMLAWVWEGLCAPEGATLARDLVAQHRFALVDEFQDTDDLQWKIFRRLYLESVEPSWLTVVGDPKQAIYSFRGADLGTYVAAVKQLTDGGAKLSRLDTCFRSTSDLIAALNNLFLEPTPFFTGAVSYHPVESGGHVIANGPGDEPIFPISLLDVRGVEKTDDIKAALDTFIPQEIQRLVGGRATLTTRGDAAPIRYRDIFVLTRTGDEASRIATALRTSGVPCSLYRQEGLFQTDEASEILDLLAGIADPHDRAARLKAFATRFLRGHLADLHQLRHADSTHPAYMQLLAWKRDADRRAYEDLFARILTDSHAIERELLTAPSQRAVENIHHIFDLLLADVARSRCDLWELSLRLRTWIAETKDAPPDERDLQRLESDSDAVHVMSIHKSKGLEAAVVFVYGGLGGGRNNSVHVVGSGRERTAFVGKLDEDTKKREDNESAAEDRRLLYVALTRAKAALYLPVPNEVTRRCAYQQMANRLGALVDNPPRGFERVDLTKVSEPADTMDIAAALSVWQPPPHLLARPKGRQRLRDLRAHRTGPAITSYTRLKAYDDKSATLSAFDADEVPTSRPEIRLPDTHVPPGARSGIFLHAALEHVPRASLEESDLAAWQARTDITALFENLARRHDIARRHIDHSQKLVYAALTTPVTLPDGTAIPGIGTSERDLREVEIAFPIPGKAERGFVRGVIDLVFSVDGRVYFLDWKSDLLPSYEPADLAADVASRYQLQLDIYTLAVAKMVGAENDATAFETRVGGGIYWFLRGAGDGERGVFSWRPRGADLARIKADLAARSYR